jgi:hypothetical protein
MPHVIWRDGEAIRTAALPRGVTAIDELTAKPFADGTPHIVIDDKHPAAGASVSRIMVDFDSGAVDVLPPAPPVVTVDDVVGERERRLALGFDYAFGDARGVHRIGTTEADMKGWEEVDKAASALIALGMGGQSINIVTDTGATTVTALEWKQIILAATLHRQPIWAASFMLQATTPIPADYADDRYWKG